MWTQFMDMHSGGGLKEEWSHIYIEAPEDEATAIFYNRFGHNPSRVSCTCCGDDYSISEHGDIKQLTGFDRGCRALDTPRDPETGRFRNDDPVIVAHLYLEDGENPPEGYEVVRMPPFRDYKTLDEYMASSRVLFIPADEIEDSERAGKIPTQGYVWVE